MSQCSEKEPSLSPLEYKLDSFQIEAHEEAKEDTERWEELPGPILLAIFTCLDLKDLLSIARVCKLWRESALALSLWKKKQLCYVAEDIWEDEESTALLFAQTLMFAPRLGSLELSFQGSIPQSIVSALRRSECQIRSLTLRVEEYDPELEAFLFKHSEVVELTLMDHCFSSLWAQRICETINCMRLSYLNLSKSLVLHHRGMKLECLQLEHLEYCPPEDPDEIADTALVLAKLISSSQKCLKVVHLRAPYNDVFLALADCSSLEEVDISCGEGLSVFLKAAIKIQSLKSMKLCFLPEENSTILTDIGSLIHLETLHLFYCNSFPGFPTMLPMILSLKTLQLSDVKYIGGTEMKSLIRMSSLKLKNIILSDCPCSATGSYASCRDRILPEVTRCGIHIEVNNHEEMTDSNYDYGYMPVYDCRCEQQPGR